MAILPKSIYNALPGRLRYAITEGRKWWRRMTTDRIAISDARHRQRQAEGRLRTQSHLRVLFIVIYDAMWKLDILYQAMIDDSRFTPMMLVIPAANLPSAEQEEVLRRTLSRMRQHGFEPIEARRADGTLLPPQSLTPDIIFLPTPYDIQSDPIYRYRALRDIPTCYVRYGYALERNPDWYDLLNHNTLWKYFLSSAEDQEIFRQLSRRKGENGYNSGAPIFDSFRAEEAKRDMDNRGDDDTPPLIIIAPHHSIEEWGYSLSNFMLYHQFFIDLAERYEGRIRWAFKPHPLLRHKLLAHSQWGKERTERYYNFWNAPERGRYYAEGEYVQLFYDSAAMIHDSSAFTVEYTFTCRPCLYLTKNDDHTRNFVEIARRAYDLHDKAGSAEEIISFVERIVRREEDPKINERKAFREEYLLPPNGVRTADRIIDHLASYLSNQVSQ